MDLDGRVLIVNAAGEHELLDRELFAAFARHRLPFDTREYEALRSKHFLVDGNPSTATRLLATKLRTRRSYLADFTRLHIFVVTLRCDHSCHYCQVSRVTVDRAKYDMTKEAAERAVEWVFRSPAADLKIEFQGGEPLLNFELIRFIVESAEARNATERRRLSFVVATNLSFLDDGILAFLRDHNIGVSTSLDGPGVLHNANRPRPDHDAYERTVAGIQRARAALGHRAVSALMTTTRQSLEYPREIVDAFVRHGFDHIFMRPLSPYGFARKTEAKTGYDASAFVEFYKRALDRVIEVNRDGYFLIELYAQIILTKILTPFATGYVDLRSPTGAGIGVIVYNYDGDVYATDESRMLAPMGSKRFRLGNLITDSYEGVLKGPAVRELVRESIVESMPGCSQCALNPFCGADPVENFTTQGDIVGHRPTSRFCQRNMAIIKHLFRLLHSGDRFVEDLFYSWVQNAPASELLPMVPD